MEFGVPYVKYASLSSALRSHFHLIAELNYRPKKSWKAPKAPAPIGSAAIGSAAVEKEKVLPPFPPVVQTPDGEGLEVTVENVEALAFLGQLNSFY